MPNETDEQIKQRLHSIFPDPSTAEKVVDLVVNKRPPGWSRKSNAPYYKEFYARRLKEDVDRMIKNKTELVYRYSTWCPEGGMSKQTLYNMINQSMKYLCIEMDANGYYKQWAETVKVERRLNIGVVLFFIPGYGESSVKAEEAIPREQTPVWRQKMDQWLESDNTKPFIQENLILSPEEIIQIKTELCQLQGIQAVVTTTYIKILRVK